jgi:hypothetical protein
MNTATTHWVFTRSTGSSAVRLAAIGAGGILLGFAGLQVALAAGAPLGEHVWGGTQERVLPAGMRLVTYERYAVGPIIAANLRDDLSAQECSGVCFEPVRVTS